MAHLPKHLRPRWRYLGIELESPGAASLDRRSFQQAVWDGARAMIGDVGSAELGLVVVRFEHTDGRGTAIIRVHRGTEETARAVLATVDTVGDTPIRSAIRGVSGTIRSCEENYLRIAREPLSHEVVALDSVESPAIVRSQTVDPTGDSTVLGATTLDIR